MIDKRISAGLYIERVHELDQFKDFLRPESIESILNIHTQGIGGIGKTRLLLRLQEYCASRPDELVFTRQLIDFYHTESRSKLGVMRQIVKYLGVENFPDFTASIKTYDETPDTSECEFLLSEIEENFQRNYHSFALKMEREQKRLVIFFDTYEVIQQVDETRHHATSTEFSQWIETKLFPYLTENTRIVVSGRYPLTDIDLDRFVVQQIRLPHFSIAETTAFWQNCFELRIPAELEDKLGSQRIIQTFHTLADGRPILLALFADWINYTRNPISPRELLATITKDTTSQSPAEQQKKEQELFEKALIERVASLIEPEDRAVTYMAIAYRRMTPEMFHFLTNLPIEQCREILLNRLKPLSFIKYKPQDVVLLHDEMRRMVVELWWESHDRDRKLRRGIAKKIIAYYDTVLLADKNLAEVDYETYTSEVIEYAFLADPIDGLERFGKEFDIALQDGRYDYCDLLLREAKGYDRKNPGDIPFPDVLHIRWRHIEYYRYTNREYEKALQMAQETLSAYQGREDWKDSELHGHFLRVYGSVAFSLEQFQEAIDLFQEAKRIFFELSKDLWQYRTENLIGYTYYRQGQFAIAEEALERIREGLYRLLIYGRNLKPLEYRPIFQALQLVIGNLAAVSIYTGRFERAIRNAEITLSIARLLPRNNLELARSYATAGHVSLLAGDKILAGQYLSEAENLLKDVQNRLLAGRIKPDLAILRYRVDLFDYLLEYYRAEEFEWILTQQVVGEDLHQLEYARLLIEQAIELLEKSPVIKKELADAYYALGDLYMVMSTPDRWQKAEYAFNKALQWGKESQFQYRVADTLETLVRLYYFWNGTSGITSEHKEQNALKKRYCQEQLEQLLSDYSEIRGRYLIGLADEQVDIALHLLRSQDTMQLDLAINELRQAFEYYVAAARWMQQFNEEQHYVACRVFYNRLKTLIVSESSGQILKISGEYLEKLRPLWQGEIGLDEIYQYLILQLSPIEGIREQISPLYFDIQQLLQQGDIGMASLLNACLIHIYRMLTPAGVENDEDLEQFLLQLNAQVDYYRALNDEYQANRTLRIIRKELEYLKDPSLKLAIEGYTDCHEGTLQYRRGEDGRLLEIYLQDDLHIWRKRFDDVFPTARQQALMLLTRGETRLKDAIQGWEQQLSGTKDIPKRMRLENLMIRYRCHLGETEFRLAGLLMLNEQFDDYRDNTGDHKGALHYSKAAIEDVDSEDRYRYNYACQNYVNVLYFSGKYALPEFSEEFTTCKNAIESTEDFPSLVGRLRIRQGDMLFSQYFTRCEELWGDYYYIVKAERNERKMRIMLRYYVDACNFMAQHTSANFSSAVKILQQRIQLIKDANALQSIGEGLADLWNDREYLKDKKEELYTLLQFANIRSLMLGQ